VSASVLGFRRPVLRRRHRSPIVHAFELYSEEHGEGTPVVFAHGAGGTHMTWWNQIPTFLREFRCVTYPQHGFGFSPVVSGGLGRGAFVEDLRGLLDRLEFERVSLVGQSMGGRSVLRFAAAYPERVEALVMSSTTAGYQDDDLARLRESAPGLGGCGARSRRPMLNGIRRGPSATGWCNASIVDCPPMTPTRPTRQIPDIA